MFAIGLSETKCLQGVYDDVQCTIMCRVQWCTVYSDVQSVYNDLKCPMCKMMYSVQGCTVYKDVQCTSMYSVQVCTVYKDVQCTRMYIVQCTNLTAVISPKSI